MTRPEDDPASVSVHSAFEELGRISFAEHSLESVLQTVTELAGRVLPGRPVTSVTILRERGPATVTSSGDLAVELDQAQYRLGDGPCLAAASAGRPAEIPDTRSATEWSAFAAIAAERGCDTVLSVPLPVQERLQGALNVYAQRSTASAARTREMVARFATYAAVPISNMYLYESAVERAGHLQAALDSRAVIDQAKGILMERFKMTADQAFQALARMSMENNTKVRDVAQLFVETGEFRSG
ncbi:GAF and ANTAR domain-containing protein [Blastococcus mobilis]|uniref:GAF domain-containing protein n=1 Tax=Blastococcus mobilis TaxID=1938746 RepID=A0A238UMP1_9ACTN|nr:GAF and ANTAR domain-containing protein [Blastococcus mobilis]SNR23372.1 GAF domain-containing protein [Blastococcus mobilis]